MVLTREGSQAKSGEQQRNSRLGEVTDTPPPEAEEEGSWKCKYWHWWCCSRYNTGNILREYQAVQREGGRRSKRGA